MTHGQQLVFPDWTGETVVIIGGGPSIRGMDVHELRIMPERTIAINEAGLTLTPEADLFFWTDARWGQWNLDRYHLNRSRWKFTSAQGNIGHFPGTTFIPTDNQQPFYTDGRFIAGTDGGSRAINLAYYTGAARAILIGFDMHDLPPERWQEGYWHQEHKAPPIPGGRNTWFLPQHEKMSRHLPSGFSVYNATPGSALKSWPMIDWKRR